MLRKCTIHGRDVNREKAEYNTVYRVVLRAKKQGMLRQLSFAEVHYIHMHQHAFANA